MEVERVLAKAQSTNAAAPAGPMTILLLAGAQDHGAEAHDYPRWQERWARLLGGSAAWGKGPVNLFGETALPPAETPEAPGVRVLKAQAWPRPEQFAAADVLVAYCYLDWDAPRLQQVRRHLARGKGLVVIHSATWTKPRPSAEVGALTGIGGFEFYRHGPVRLRLKQPGHPICRGLPRQIELADETYWPATPPPSAPAYTVLASSAEPVKPGAEALQPQVMFWTCEPGNGRVFGCVPGHFTWTFDDPYVRLLLLRGIAWAGRSDPNRFDALALPGARLREGD